MIARHRMAALPVTLAIGLAGCGGTSHSASSRTASPAGAQGTATQPRAGAGATAPASTGSANGGAPASSPATRTRGSDAVSTAPAPPPAGTPTPPDGLTASTGYATYELCASQCQGSVPVSLRRPLHLPSLGTRARCPVSASAGPVRPTPTSLTVTSFIGSQWLAGRVLWVSSADYRGPVLIRGRRLTGAGAVGFGEGRTPYDELQLLTAGQQAPSEPGGGRAWLSFTRVPAPGCYAYQVDGTDFSSVIVFQARG